MKIVLSLITAFAITACGSRNPSHPASVAPPKVDQTKTDPKNEKPHDSAPATLEVIGSWHSPTADDHGITIDQTIVIADKALKVRKTCTSKGQVTNVEATGAAVTDAATIDLQEPLDNEVVVAGGDPCAIHIEKQRIDYEVKDGQLFFKKDDKSVLVGDRKTESARPDVP